MTAIESNLTSEQLEAATGYRFRLGLDNANRHGTTYDTRRPTK